MDVNDDVYQRAVIRVRKRNHEHKIGIKLDWQSSLLFRSHFPIWRFIIIISVCFFVACCNRVQKTPSAERHRSCSCWHNTVRQLDNIRHVGTVYLLGGHRPRKLSRLLQTSWYKLRVKRLPLEGDMRGRRQPRDLVLPLHNTPRVLFSGGTSMAPRRLPAPHLRQRSTRSHKPRQCAAVYTSCAAFL